MTMRTALFVITALTVIGLPLCPGLCLAQDEATEAPAFDTLFIEMLLSERGVWALDTSGQEWHYDFELEQFLPGPISVDRPSDLAQDSRPRRNDAEYTTRLEPILKLDKGSITIAEDEWVDGDVEAWGRITIKGWVKGDVTSLENRVLVTQTGRVDGDITAARVIVREGAEVGGKVTEEVFDIGDISAPFSADALIVAISFSALMVLGTLILVSLLPRQTRRVHECMSKYQGRTCLVGFLLVPGIVVIMALVIITIVGILLTPIIPLLYLAAALLGFISIGSRLGGWVIARAGGSRQSFLIRALLGVLLLMLPWLATGILLGSGNSVAGGFGQFFRVVSILLTMYASFCGLGASFLTRFGFREYQDRASLAEALAPAPAPPPIPDLPPVIEPAPPAPPASDETSDPQSRKMDQKSPNRDRE